MKNILICLERLDIGGVESAVMNQTTYFLKQGYHVIILAKSGIYTETLKNKGASVIEFDFTLQNGFDFKKSSEIVHIINKYQISEVHIHQFPCILSVFPACLIANVPYVAYLHMSIDGVFDWFINTYPIYEEAFPLYFTCAHKIISITKQVKQTAVELFNIESTKCKVLYNGIDFEELENKKIECPKYIKNFMLITRLSKEKQGSIQNAISFYTKYVKEDPNISLTIVGDGELREELEDCIKRNDLQNVTFLGARNDVMELVKQADVVIRCGSFYLRGYLYEKASNHCWL